jgi:hypothetical protein
MSWCSAWFPVVLLATLSLWREHPVQPVPGGPVAPEVFGAGVLSAGQVYRGCFSADGHTFYFFRKVGEPEQYRIFESRRTGSGWAIPRQVILGGEFSDLYPSISRDGRRLVFSSYRPVPGAADEKPNAHLWYVDRHGDGWGSPVFLGKASTRGHYHSWVQLGYDGRLYFRRTTPDWTETRTLVSRWNGREFDTPQPYDDAERWKGWRPDVDVVGGSPGPDGTTVFLDVATRNPATGRGASDIWVSVRHGDTWGSPRRLGLGINSDGYDVFPFFSPDGRDLFFVRDFAAFYRIPLRDALRSASP